MMDAASLFVREGPIARATLLAVCLLFAWLATATAQQATSRFEVVDSAAQQEPAVDLSDAYYTRLAIHRAGSYAILPLFAAQYYLGDQLLNAERPGSWVKPAHRATAIAVGTVFVANTVTGALNVWEARHVPDDRTRRYAHVALMLAADAGFAYTGLVAARDASDLSDGADRHRNAALVSIGLATAGTLLMWLRGSD